MMKIDSCAGKQGLETLLKNAFIELDNGKAMPNALLRVVSSERGL